MLRFISEALIYKENKGSAKKFEVMHLFVSRCATPKKLGNITVSFKNVQTNVQRTERESVHLLYIWRIGDMRR